VPRTGDCRYFDKACALVGPLRGPGESYSDVIIRVARG
jgi:hypothetical protein